jgi:uncharacterized protein DUF4288
MSPRGDDRNTPLSILFLPQAVKRLFGVAPRHLASVECRLEVVMWYAAHVIMYFKFKTGRQGRFCVWENVFIVEAASTDEAFEKAEHLGRAEEGDDGSSLRLNNRPVTLTYAGIRKVVRVGCGTDGEPADGVEATYSVLEVQDRRALNRLVAGKSVTVRYEE